MLSIFSNIPSRVYEASSKSRGRLQARDVYKGRDYDIAGTSYDPETGQVTFPPRLTEAQRDAIRDSLEAIAIGNARFPENAAGRDPANPESLFGQFDRDRPYAGASRSICRAPWASMRFHAVFPTVKLRGPFFLFPNKRSIFLKNPNITLTHTTLIQKAGNDLLKRW